MFTSEIEDKMSVKFTAFSAARGAAHVAAGLAVLLGATALLNGAIAHEPGVEVGVLNCRMAGGAGYVVGSTKEISCVFDRPGRDERYVGTISKLGIDVGATSMGNLAWGVVAPTNRIGRGALAGNYGGVSGEATVGVGVGVNALVGGSERSIVLQPVSVQTQEGLNIAAGVASLELRPVRR